MLCGVAYSQTALPCRASPYSDMALRTIYNIHKTIYTSFQKPGHKAKICRCHLLPSSIRRWFFKRLTVRPNRPPHTDNNSGAVRAGLRARAKEKWGAGRTLFESAFYSFLFEKALELFGSAPNIYFLSRALRPARMVSWLFVWGGRFGRNVKAVEVHLP